MRHNSTKVVKSKASLLIFIFILFSINDAISQDHQIGETYQITSDDVSVSESSSPTSPRKGEIPKGQMVEVIDINESGIKVKVESHTVYPDVWMFSFDLHDEADVRVVEESSEKTRSQKREGAISALQDRSGTSSTTSFNFETNDVGGLIEVPIMINDQLELDFIVDTGASDLTIAPDVAMTLIRTDTIDDSDLLGTTSYRLADGSISDNVRIRLNQIEIDDITLYNVEASVSSNIDAPMLLGQNVLSEFDQVIIDYSSGTIEFQD